VLLDRALLVRSFLVLGLTEAVVSLGAFTVVLVVGGWRFGDDVSGGLHQTASGTAFAAIALGQMANAFACRSTTRPVWRLGPWGNPLVVAAVAAEGVLLVAVVGLPWLADLLGGSWPTPVGWAGAAAAGVAVLVVHGAHKRLLRPFHGRGDPRR
jgi:magnesium-transporting ATPase (P-type)